MSNIDTGRNIVLEINSKRFVVGLVWKTFFFETNSQKNRKLRTCKASLDKPSGVIVDSKGICALGLASEEFKGRVYSLAALLSKTYKNSVHLHELEDGVYWVCWIKKGVPVAGGECFFSTADEVKDFVVADLMPLTGAVEYFGDRKLVPSSLEEYFTDHDLETTVISLNERDRSSRIKHLYFSKNLKILVATLVLVFIASVSAYGVYNVDEDFADRAQKLLERQTDRIKRRLDKSKNLFFSTLHNYSNRAHPNDWIKSVIATVGGFPDYYKGWTLKSIECNGEDNKCNLYWKSTHHGTNANFINRFTESRITFHPNGQEALITVDIHVAEESTLSGEKFYENLPTKPFFYGQHLSKIQYLQGSEVFRYEVGDDSDELSTPLEHKIVNGKAVADKSESIGVFIRNWKLKGTGLYHLAELSRELPGNSFVVDSLEIIYDIKVDAEKLASWNMEGRYAHKQ